MNLLQQVTGQAVCPGYGGDAFTTPLVIYRFKHIRPDCPERKKDFPDVEFSTDRSELGGAWVDGIN